MFVVKTPNPAFTGQRAGVSFVKGVGTCDALQAPLMAQLGYEVSEVQEAEKTPQEPNVRPSRASQRRTGTRKTRTTRTASEGATE